MRKIILITVCMMLIGIIDTHCTWDQFEDPVTTHLIPYERLSDYDIFQLPLRELNPRPNVYPYDLNTPLFSDYAEKSRFIYLPPGKKIMYMDEEVMEFPVGTILIKNFYYTAEDQEQLLETRLLMRMQEGWEGFPYVWEENQKDAFLMRGGVTIETSHPLEKGQIFHYSVPNQNQCKGCHNLDNDLSPIGPKAGNLNRLSYTNGIVENQLDHWISLGILSGLASSREAPKYPVWDDPRTGSLKERARIYMDVNCGHCHRPEGPANNSRLFLNLKETDPYSLGFCKSPLAPGRATGGRSFDIVPGDPNQSILLFRLESVEPDIRMPELGRKLPHAEGIKLIREWIDSLEEQPCGN